MSTRNEYHRQWRLKNPDKLKAYKRKYNDAHRLELSKYNQQYYQRNRDALRKKHKAWYWNNRPIVLRHRRDTYANPHTRYVRGPSWKEYQHNWYMKNKVRKKEQKSH